MAKIRVYSNKNLRTSSLLKIEDEDFHYLKNVMRLKKNENFNIFNEINGEFNCNIIEINKKDLKIQIEEQIHTPAEENLNDTELIFPPIRHQRLDFLIEKATELGITQLSPIITQNTSVKNINTERIFTISKEATEQSRRLSIPKINELLTFKEKIAKFDFLNRTLIYLDERQNDNQTTTEILKKFKNKPVSFLIGPEGGFSQEEFEILSKTQAQGITLGKQILRAETAGISIIALYNIGV